MTHRYETCKSCHDEHIVLRNGEMSIHFLEDGTRCAGSGDAQAHVKRQRLADDERSRRNEDERERRRKERERAAANDKQLRAYISHMMNTGPVDRRIYGAPGHTVSGGLPGTNRRH